MKDVMMEIKTQKIFYSPPHVPTAEDEAKAKAEKD